MITILSDIHLEGFENQNFIYVDEAMKSCTGCFSCWIKTPGLCIFDDTLNDQIIKSDSLIIISKNTFGSYSSKVKSVIDKSIPLVLPTFKVVNNETHHQKRYNKYPDITSIVYDSPNKETLSTYTDMVKAHGVNLHASHVIVHDTDKSKLASTLSEIIGGQHV